MILVDSSVWIDHFRSSDATLVGLLASQQVLVHPVVIGKLLLAGLPKSMPLGDPRDLPMAETIEDNEVLLFIQRHNLAGCGIGYADAHLLASTRLTSGAALWTRNRRLLATARSLGLDADIEPYGGMQEE